MPEFIAKKRVANSLSLPPLFSTWSTTLRFSPLRFPGKFHRERTPFHIAETRCLADDFPPRQTRMDAALDAMRQYGFPDRMVRRETVRELLEVSTGEWHFHEAEAYMTLREAGT
ncbi:hypothetical protein BT93_G2237 [Corymbia citriodora subsp. variegata]|nr:hypothetical protein BT93_G2237 [Corymbia citriodora subsp. variegata]